MHSGDSRRGLWTWVLGLWTWGFGFPLSAFRFRLSAFRFRLSAFVRCLVGSCLVHQVWTFQSRLGWMAILGRDAVLKGLAFGCPSADRAVRALRLPSRVETPRCPWNRGLVARLQAYAAGAEDSFLDIEVDLGDATAFQRRVIDACRRIPWGSTLSYGQLAAKAGAPGAARAVGRCMAANRIPLIIPCHRVLGADGGLHGYSGPGGLATKRRLLELEGAWRNRAGFCREER